MMLPSYGSSSHEHDSLLERRPQQSVSRSAVLVVLNFIVAGGIGVSMYTSLQRYDALSAKLDTYLSHVPAAMTSLRHEGGHLPSKYAVQHVTPRKDQSSRGTCWDFSTIGVLEQSYRAHGLARGWLEEDEYVSFSEQAYGVEVMELCTGDPQSPQQVACRVAGDAVTRIDNP
ncbi:hypothetical protein ACHHYP_00566 [Achlya hypogyna]|uniref:Peptidase C1A papain C-terminal domain-containing protein n=1 Tax=Achlya hypogyna TaxID=1202772 RepID=A0A1V9ZUC3_ACHHY|nr:hypothetical protein ACHHYP_00566 [Achlya hypogyna]